MKKSVIVLIAIIYVAAIGLVSFYGLKFKVFEEVVPVESIELLNTGLNTDKNGEPFVVIYPDSQGRRQYQLEYRVHPDNATDTKVSFAIDSPANAATVSETGLVVFEKSGSAKIFIVAADGSNAQVTLLIVAR